MSGAIPIELDGSLYLKVSDRAQQHLTAHPDEAVTFQVTYLDENLVLAECRILNSKGETVANGFAEEDRTKGDVNRTSAVENAQTSAWGRALFTRGYPGDPDPKIVTLEENGKLYETVVIRAKKHRDQHQNDRIIFKIQFIKRLVLVECQILDSNGQIRCNGFAEENRDQTEKAVEIGQTSALGRALFARGFGCGEICSKEEIDAARRAREAAENQAKDSAARSESQKQTDSSEKLGESDQVMSPYVSSPLLGAKGMKFERQEKYIFAIGETSAAAHSVRELLNKEGFQPNIWCKRVSPDSQGIPGDLPQIDKINYHRIGTLVIASGETKKSTKVLKKAGFIFGWWAKPISGKVETGGNA